MDGPEPVAVGQILSGHGLSGRVKVRVLSDVPHRFDVGQELYVLGTCYQVNSSSQVSPDQIILKLQGIDTPEAARGLTGQLITVPEEAVPQLPDGEYFHYQLLGLRVLTEDGEDLGQLTEILETGSKDVYVVSGPAGEVLVPALADVIRSIRLDQGEMLVRLPEGLR